MGLEEDSSEYEKKVALALGVSLGAIAESASDQLSRLYIGLHVGGGFFYGRPMTKDLARATRYELLPYMAALTSALVQERPQRTVPEGPILYHFEKMIFSLDLEKARPTYAYYLDRYYHPQTSDPSSFPRETIIHREFMQRLAKIWNLFQRIPRTRQEEYVVALSDLSRQIEAWVNAALDGTWPKS